MAKPYIDGAWRDAPAAGGREICCPEDGSLVHTLSEGDRDDVDLAVDAARRAFDAGPWPLASDPLHQV